MGLRFRVSCSQAHTLSSKAEASFTWAFLGAVGDDTSTLNTFLLALQFQHSTVYVIVPLGDVRMYILSMIKKKKKKRQCVLSG